MGALKWNQITGPAAHNATGRIITRMLWCVVDAIQAAYAGDTKWVENFIGVQRSDSMCGGMHTAGRPD